MKKQTRGKRLLSILLACIMLLSLVPTVAFATGTQEYVTTEITIKPKDVGGEFISRHEVIYKATEFEYVGEGRLNEGDVFTDIVYSGERRYAGESESTITSYKIMRGDVNETQL